MEEDEAGASGSEAATDYEAPAAGFGAAAAVAAAYEAGTAGSEAASSEAATDYEAPAAGLPVATPAVPLAHNNTGVAGGNVQNPSPSRSNGGAGEKDGRGRQQEPPHYPVAAPAFYPEVAVHFFGEADMRAGEADADAGGEPLSPRTSVTSTATISIV